jgi:hypothetical protein
MIQMLFSLRFQAQLRRTRPELCKYIENAVVETIKASGGMVGFERRHISASFDEAAIGFWIDVLTVVETIVRIMEEADSELYGHLGILGRDLGEEGPLLFQTLPSGGTGIWCDPFVQMALAPYCVF